MSFTAKLGTLLSALGNIELGLGAIAPPPPITPNPYPIYRFTSVPGIPLSTPGHISPGLIASSLIASKTTGNAGLSFTTVFFPIVYGKLLFKSLATVITQIRTLTLQVVNRTTAQTDTLPASLDITTLETDPISVDFTGYVVAGDTVSVPSCVLRMQSNNAVVSTPWQYAALSVNGNIVQIPIDASKLAVGQSYILLTSVTLNSGKRLTATTTLNVIA